MPVLLMLPWLVLMMELVCILWWNCGSRASCEECLLLMKNEANLHCCMYVLSIFFVCILLLVHNFCLMFAWMLKILYVKFFLHSTFTWFQCKMNHHSYNLVSQKMLFMRGGFTQTLTAFYGGSVEFFKIIESCYSWSV